MGKFCPHPKFAQKEVRRKKIFVFLLPALPKKGGSPDFVGTGGWGEGSASLPDRSICFFD